MEMNVKYLSSLKVIETKMTSRLMKNNKFMNIITNKT